nr:cysteine desulfurase family protein [Mariprofundus ferrinatatus]
MDYAATTPVGSNVLEKMRECLSVDGTYGNPSSPHSFGEKASIAIENAREQVASLIGASPKEIVFTSGATESNNLTLKGVFFGPIAGKHIITTEIEHKSILDTCSYLEKMGAEVTRLKPDSSGLIDLDELENSIREDTSLVSIIHVNNETGVIQDVEKIASIVKKKGCLLHVDAAQSIGKLSIDLSKIPIDLMSISAHKIYGPKGIGCLFVRKGLERNLQPQMHGGGQEGGLRSGTMPTHQIVGMGKALSLAQERMAEDHEMMSKLKEQLLAGLSGIQGMYENGSIERSVPNILNVSFDGIDAELLLHRLRNKIAISNGSACNSGAIEPSYVLRSMGLSEDRVYGAIRISMGRYTSNEDIDLAVHAICDIVANLRS